MNIFFSLALTALLQPLWAQDHRDPDLLSTQRTLGSAQKLPISIGANGEIRFFKEGPNPDLSASPTIHLGYKKSSIHYRSPVVGRSLALERPSAQQRWIEYRTVRRELGIGLRFSDEFRIGILPYRGSFQTTVRSKENRGERLGDSGLPRSLSHLIPWFVGDQGHFQTYGGVVISARLNVGGINVASAALGIQNQFLVSLKKQSDHTVELTLTEEHLHQRRLRAGPAPVNLSFYHLQGKLFRASFELDTRNPEHHLLYEDALRGNILKLQANLVNVSERVSWSGTDWNFYFGIPHVAGEAHNRSTFSYGLGEEQLDVHGKRTKGKLTVFRDHQNYLHSSTEGVSLFWTSKMKKVNRRTLRVKFLARARTLGLEDFGHGMDGDHDFGSVITHLGVGFSRTELEALNSHRLPQVAASFQERCQELELKCARGPQVGKVVSKLRQLLAQSWKNRRRELGQLLMKEPALIYALNKELDLKKSVYFKFLSDRYQSVEGVQALSL